jgi:hypothetical protein
MSDRRASRLTTSLQRCALACVSALAPINTSGVSVAGAMFISERSERTVVTRSTTQPISPSALGSSSPSSDGHSVSVRSRGRFAAAATSQSSSVMKGMNGCSSLRISSRAQATIARVSAFAAPSGPVNTGFASSRYQSQ